MHTVKTMCMYIMFTTSDAIVMRDYSWTILAVMGDLILTNCLCWERIQNNDKNLKPVIDWMERGNDRPQWQEVAPHSAEVKAYWAQWQSLQLCDGQRKLELPWASTM